MIAGCASISVMAASALSQALRCASSSLRRGAASIEQRLPTQLRDETAQLLFGQAVGAVVVKMIGHALIFQPAAGFLMVSQF